MSDKTEHVENYVADLFGCSDETLESAQRLSDEAGLPDIRITSVQGKFLCLIAKMVSAKHILEIGTLGGFSTIWLARGLTPGGRLVTLELESLHAEVAQKNIEQAGLKECVEIVVGPALDTLPKVECDLQSPFDLVFIDADKEGYSEYLKWAVRLARPGAVILADNVVRGGTVLNPDPEDTAAIGAREFNAALAEHPQLDSVVVQQTGTKGHDGIAVAVVKR